MNIIKKRIDRYKYEWNFEKNNKKYFITHYIRIIILLFLVFVATYYYSTDSICEDWGGELKKDQESFYKTYCVYKIDKPNDLIYFNPEDPKHTIKTQNLNIP